MQALRAQSRTSGLKLEEIDIPKLSPSDVLIKVVSAGVSPGMVKMIQAGKTRVPSTAGHEVAGTIESWEAMPLAPISRLAIVSVCTQT